MKTLLLALLLAAPACSIAAEPAKKPAPDPRNTAAPFLTQADIEAITRAITEPAIYVVRWGTAGALTRAKLVMQLRERFPRREPPDRDLVRLCLKLTLRVNNAWLDTISGFRIYPGQEEFDRYAADASAALIKYEAGLPAAHKWGPVDDKAAQDIVDRELRRGVNRRPVYRGSGRPPEPPPSAEELAALK